jgi:hypothetical protein
MKAIIVELLLLIVTAVCCTFVGHHYGELVIQEKWDAQKIVDAEATAKELKEANDKVHQIEQAANAKVYQVSANYEAKLRKKDNEKNDFIAKSRSDGLWVDAICPKVYPSQLSSNSSTTSRPDGSSTVRLSDETTISLINYAAQANKVAEQLRGLQEYVKKLQETQNAK